MSEARFGVLLVSGGGPSLAIVAWLVWVDRICGGDLAHYYRAGDGLMLPFFALIFMTPGLVGGTILFLIALFRWDWLAGKRKPGGGGVGWAVQRRSDRLEENAAQRKG